MDTPQQMTAVEQAPKQKSTVDAKKQLARIYRLFSSKKYLKYKHQFPRMKETEIVNKIIREWQSMSRQEKLGLKNIYTEKEMLGSDSDDSSWSKEKPNKQDSQEKRDKKRPAKRKQQNKKTENIIQQQSKNKPPVQKQSDLKVESSQQQGELSIPLLSLNLQSEKIQLEAKQSAKEEESHNNKGEQQEEEVNSESQSPGRIKQEEKKIKVKKQTKKQPKKQANHKPPKKSKQIAKRPQPIKKLTTKQKPPINYSQLKNSQYIMFYKHYFKKFQQEHPKWSSTQITFIIKLLWRKKNHQAKSTKLEGQKIQRKVKRQGTKQNIHKKTLSGRQLFTLSKSKQLLPKQQIATLWKRLPRESKNDWNKRAEQMNKNTSTIQIKQNSNIKTETTATKTQSKQRKVTTIVTFRDLLLKGRVHRPEKQSDLNDNDIIEEKKDDSAPKRTKETKQQAIDHKKQPQILIKQDVQYVSLQANPFSFLRKKMDTKILFE